jgi:Ca-activated chloride channel family protein
VLGDQFANGEFLWLIILVPLCGAVIWWRRRTLVAEVRFSSIGPLMEGPRSVRERLRQAPLALRLTGIALLIVALARPQSVSSRENISTEGIDIVLILDISGSMLAEDFSPNRLVAAKQVAKEFIDGRQNDRIGLVTFAGESFTQCPLTTDYNILKSLLDEVKNGMIVDGTAIGLSIANGVSRLKESKAKSRVIILLTDGVNNRGEIDPITAARLAATFNIKIYTVGVGAQGMAPYPQRTALGIRRVMQPVDLDEKTLRSISSMTAGQYFRAIDNTALRSIYREIDTLERTTIEVTAYRRISELFPMWLWGGAALILLELLLHLTVFRKIP